MTPAAGPTRGPLARLWLHTHTHDSRPALYRLGESHGHVAPVVLTARFVVCCARARIAELCAQYRMPCRHACLSLIISGAAKGEGERRCTTTVSCIDPQSDRGEFGFKSVTLQKRFPFREAAPLDEAQVLCCFLQKVAAAHHRR